VIALITPKAFANSSPALERSDNAGEAIKNQRTTLKGFANRGTLSGFNVYFGLLPRVLASSNPGLKLANAFGVIIF
jgi:hypothetical protein